ncbi:YDG domain-containing protein [Gehongia tenuis]|uniref:YDG domain-containing protein n=1 Tax=Gehongia tenuis TaxID=2763655 RepID=A0A926D314_9FIRM|nr:YDG domain-containing protein [Gehongia tenuis]MBC8530587.1 hypothetical protein [Gehongia tenuis]
MRIQKMLALLAALTLLMAALPAAVLADPPDTFTITYMTNTGVEMGTLTYPVGDPGNAFPASGFGTLFPDFSARLSQGGGLYLSNNLSDRWYLDAAYTSPAVFPDGQAGDNFTVYCRWRTGSISAGSLSKTEVNMAYDADFFHILSQAGLTGQYVTGRNDAYDAAIATFEKKVDGVWQTVPDSCRTDKDGNTYPNAIFFQNVADSGVYRVKNFRYTATDSSGVALFYEDAEDVPTDEIVVKITPAELTITGVTAVDRTCDGTAEVALAGGTLEGVLYGDAVSFNLGTGTVQDGVHGADIPVTTDIQLTGAKAGNYTLVQSSGLTAAITADKIKVDAKAATCTEAGSTAHWHCKGCDRLFSDEACLTALDSSAVQLQPLGHSAVKVPAKAPAAAEAGNIEYWHCPACGLCFKDGALTEPITLAATVLPATGTPGVSPAPAPGSSPAATPGTAVPATGHNGGGLLWALLFLCSGLTLAGIQAFRRRT